MISDRPHYLLFSEASPAPAEASGAASWRFVLEHVHTDTRFSASDTEPNGRSETGARASAERLELLAVVRGLEALDGPARVTLVTKSRYVSRGLKRGLAEWRNSGWRWERFGKLAPIRDADLWQRVDQALKFHDVRCRLWQFSDAFSDESLGDDETAQADRRALSASEQIPVRRGRQSGQTGRRGALVAKARRGIRRAAETMSAGSGAMAAG